MIIGASRCTYYFEFKGNDAESERRLLLDGLISPARGLAKLTVTFRLGITE